MTAPGDAWSRAKRHVAVLGHRMAAWESGAGRPIVFLHGNPTSSYLWRNIAPRLTHRGRCIAPDLIGMGDSDRLTPSGPGRYRFVEHRDYLDACLEALDVADDVVLVVHDWGSALGLDWANRHREQVAGICYMEGLVRPMTWDEWPEAARAVFEGFRSDAGEAMALERNVFVERVLPGSVLGTIAAADMDAYRRPFLEPGESRRPTLTWPREIPLAGEPEDVCRIVADYGAWMADNDLPKLFVNAEPGAILVGPQREFCRTWRNQEEVTVPGNHFLQEDSSEAIADAIDAWLGRLDAGGFSPGMR